MATFSTIDPQLKSYLLKHRIPDLFECIFTALAASKPENPNQFILDRLREFKRGDRFDLLWDSFVEKKDLPAERVFKKTFIEKFFTLEDLAALKFYFYFQPTEEEKRTAAQHYNDTLLKTHFGAWLGYHNRKLEKRRRELAQQITADRFYKENITRKAFLEWHQWKCARFRNQQKAAPILAAKMKRIALQNAINTTFRAWKQVTKHASDTNQWFKRYETLASDDDEPKKKDEGGQDFISQLPKRASKQIFRYLNVIEMVTCTLVCRSWKMLVQERSLWSQIDCYKIKDRTTDRLLASLTQKFRSFLCNLNLRQCVRLSPSSLRCIGECRNLQELNLSNIQTVNADVINDIGAGCQNLLYLNLSGCWFTDGAMRMLASYTTLFAAQDPSKLAAFKELASSLHTYNIPSVGRSRAQRLWARAVAVVKSQQHYLNLQYLSLANCRGFTTAGVYYFMVGKGLHKLFHLDISGCTQITEEGMHYIARGCPLLSSLILNNMKTMTDECVYYFTKYCHHLQKLSLLHAAALTDVAITYIAESLPKLTYLALEGNHNITGASMKLLGRGCPDLVYLFLADCFQMCDNGLKGFAATKGLRVLNLADCVRVTDTGVRCVVEGPSGPTIRELNLTNCLRVGDTTLLRIAQRCHSVAYARFCYCEWVSDAGVELLGNMQSLRCLDLSGCAVQDAGLASLGNNPNFRSISLSECTLITDVGIQKMCSKLLLLESLDISHCVNITDYAIKFLAFSCRELVRLNISNCTLLTETSVSYISGGCHYLSHLNMSSIKNIGDKALRFLRRGCKLLQQLNIKMCPLITLPAIQRVENGGCVVLHSIDLKAMKLGPVQPPTHTYKRPMSVGYSIFVPNYYNLGHPVFAPDAT